MHDELGRIRVAAGVLPFRQTPGAQSVPADNVSLAEMRIEEAGDLPYLPFIEISRPFQLTQNQVDNETDLRSGLTLARLAATAVALAEDRLIFQGAGAPLPPGVNTLRGNSARRGLLGFADPAKAIPVTQPDPVGRPGQYGENTFRAVTAGIAALLDQGQPGPYALIVHSSIFADAHAPLPGVLVTPADRIRPLVPGGLHGTGAVPERTGLLVSLGGDPTNLAVSQDAVAEYLQKDDLGWHHLRVVERIQFVVRDPRALIRLDFDAPAKQKE